MQNQTTWIVFIHPASDIKAPPSYPVHPRLPPSCHRCSCNLQPRSYYDRDIEDNRFTEWNERIAPPSYYQVESSRGIAYPATSSAPTFQQDEIPCGIAYPAPPPVPAYVLADQHRASRAYSQKRTKPRRPRLRQAFRSARDSLPRCHLCPVS